VLDQARAAAIDDHLPAARTAPEALLGALLRHLDELDVLAQQRIDEGGEIDALGIGEPGEPALHFGIQIDRHVQRRTWPVELATRTAGEVDLGGHLIIGRYVCGTHNLNPIGVRSHTAVVREESLCERR
jgi:hypothetical protein